MRNPDVTIRFSHSQISGEWLFTIFWEGEEYAISPLYETYKRCHEAAIGLLNGVRSGLVVVHEVNGQQVN